MEGCFQKMTGEYARKHFPGGSVLEDARRTSRRRDAAGVLFLLVFLVGAAWGLAWSAGRALELRAQGQDDLLGVGVAICAVFGLAALGLLAAVLIVLKRLGKGRDAYLANIAERSKLPVGELEAFERQAVASDCYILKLTAGLDRALSNATNKDGLLTRDYVYLADPGQTVLRVDGLKECYLSWYSYYVTVGKIRKKVRCLAISLVGGNGVSVLSDTTGEAGRALMAMLKERNGGIDTREGEIVEEGEHL